MVRLAYSNRYQLDLPPEHPFPYRKYELLREQLEYLGIARAEQFFEPDELLPDDIVLGAHDATYWHRLKALELTDTEVRRIGLPLTDKLVRRAHSSATNSFHAALHALEDGIAAHLGGGTHHAYADRAEGYCLLNDVAISIRHLLREGRIRRPMVIDLDVHQGNGTAVMLRDVPEAFTFSMHARDNYPIPKEQSTLDIDLPTGTDDATYLSILNQHLPRLLNSHKPDMVYYIAGSDVLATDRLGKLSLSQQGAADRDDRVLRQVHRLGIHCVVVMGGGYSRDIRHSVDANCNTFRLIAEYYD